MIRPHTKRRSRRWGVAALALACAMPLAAMAPAHGAVTNLSLVASNNQVSATSVTFTIVFQSGAADKAIAVVLPSGVTGAATANVSVQTSSDGTNYSSPALDGTTPKLLSTDGQRIGINLNAAITSGTWVKVVITGLTNPSSTGGVTVTVGGKTLLNLTLVDLDGTLAALQALLAEYASVTYTVVAVATNGITNNVGVAPALSFAAGSASHAWSLDPAGTASSSAVTDTLTVATNAQNYQLQGLISGDLVREGTDGSSASDKIPYNAAAGSPHFGYEVTGPAGDTVDSTAYHTFGTSAANLVNGWSLSGLTNSEVTTVNYDVLVDYTKAAGNYVGSVTYRVVPSY